MKKWILVTGASKGIGKSLIKKFAENGYNIIFTYNSSFNEAVKTKEEIENKFNVSLLLYKLDIRNENQIKNLVNEIKENKITIDVLINNAAYSCDNEYINKTKKEFMDVLEVNVVGTFLVTKYILDVMNKGIVVNISSRDADDTFNELSMDYCASKAALNSLTKTFSLARPDIKFIAFMLPWVNTEAIKEMLPSYLEGELKRTNQNRLLEPYEVANFIYKNINKKEFKSGKIIKMEV